jgi:hypothetical protein
MTLKNFQETIVSGSGVLVSNETGIPFDLPPFQMTFDLGIEEAVQEVIGPTGLRGTAGSYQTAQRGVLNLTFTHKAPEVLELVTGRKWKLSAGDIDIAKQITVPSSGLVPAVGTGTEGFGMAANNPDSKASKIGEFRMTMPLKRVPWVEAPATPLLEDEWMQGPNFAMRFAPNLAAKREVVTVISTVPQTSYLELGEEPTGTYSVIILFTYTTGGRLILTAGNGAVSVAGNSLDMNAADTPVKLRLDQEPGSCYSYKLKRSVQKVAC